jgi:hypothetical protein
MKTNGKDASEVSVAIHAAIDKYGDEFPEVKKALQPFADTLDQRASDAASSVRTVNMNSRIYFATHGTMSATISAPPPEVNLDNDEIDAWSHAIGDTVDGLGKADQLGLINIQEFNAEINQAKQTASALLDSVEKAANSIINHIG